MPRKWGRKMLRDALNIKIELPLWLYFLLMVSMFLVGSVTGYLNAA